MFFFSLSLPISKRSTLAKIWEGCSLSTGICNDGTVICDNRKKVGKEIQEQLDNVYFHDATIKRSLKVRNIEKYQAYCLITLIDWYRSKRKTSKDFSATNSKHFLRPFSKMD